LPPTRHNKRVNGCGHETDGDALVQSRNWMHGKHMNTDGLEDWKKKRRENKEKIHEDIRACISPTTIGATTNSNCKTSDPLLHLPPPAWAVSRVGSFPLLVVSDSAGPDPCSRGQVGRAVAHWTLSNATMSRGPEWLFS
jgi:hypothetical protein